MEIPIRDRVIFGVFCGVMVFLEAHYFGTNIALALIGAWVGALGMK